MAGEDLLLRLRPEVEVGGGVGNDQARQLVGPPGDLQLEARQVIAQKLGNRGGDFEEGHGAREGQTLYPKVARMHVTVA